MTKQVEINGITYESVPETNSSNSCKGCAAASDDSLCDKLGSSCCDNHSIWIKKEKPMNVTEQATETVEVPVEEPKYTVEEFSEAFSNIVGVHVSDWDTLQIKKYLDKQNSPDYQLYLKLKKQFGE